MTRPLGVVDDRRHSVLRKARPIQQAAIDAFAGHSRVEASRLVPRGDFGRYEVREIEVKTALTPCAMPSEPWSLNPYTGCSHDCGYCYVPDVAHLERWRWGSYVLVKRNLPTVLAHELKRKERREVFMSSATDPYQPAEKDHRITRRSVEVLLRADWPIYVLTRNPLVKRDLSIFKRFSEVGIGMSVPTLDDELRRLVEPGAPPIEGRLRTLRAMADEGLQPYANLMPTYPLLAGVKPDDVAKAFRDAGVVQVNAGAWRYTKSVAPFIRERLAGTKYAGDFERAMEAPGYYERLFLALRGAFRRAGVGFSC